jgi:hypothetical protein
MLLAGPVACSSASSVESTSGETSAALSDASPIVSGVGGLCLDDSGDSTANANKIQIWTCNGTNAQGWTYENGTFVGPGGKCLDIQYNNQTSGTPVDLYACNGTTAQQWKWDGKAIKSTSGLCLDVQGGVNANGTQVQVSTCNGTDAQVWTTASAPPPASESVTSFSLVAASNRASLSTIGNGAIVNLSDLGNQSLSVQANTNPGTVGSVSFDLDNGAYTHTENIAPYALCGKSGSGDDGCSQLQTTGSHTLTATVYSGANLSGTKEGSYSVSFTITASSHDGGTSAGSPAEEFLAYAATLKASGKLLVGQHTQYYEGNTNDETEAYTSITPLYSQTGKLPAIIGVTANWYGTSDPYNQSGGGQPDLTVVKQIITDWNSSSSNSFKPEAGSGIVQINWGNEDPTGTSNGNDTPISSSALATLVTPGSNYYNQWVTNTLELQTWLLSVVEANPKVVLMVRLFAELNGNWTWFGVQNSQSDVDNQILLQKQTFTTLFGGSGASLRKNVLISYDANNYGGLGAAAAWPGKAYADVAGWDTYDAAWTSPVAPSTYSAFAAFGVPLILCEVGIVEQGQGAPAAPPDYTVDDMLIPNFLRANEPAVIGYVQWDDNGQGPSNSMSISKQNNASEVMNDSSIVTLADLPSF